MVELNEIKNKIKRQEVYHKSKLLKKKIKKPKTNQIPKTTENMKPATDEDCLVKSTLSNNVDEIKCIGSKDSVESEEMNETTQDINQDLFSQKSPKKILVTTSKRPTPNGYKFTTEFTKIFPDAEFIKRQSQFSIQKICELASDRDYTTVIVVNEDNKQPNKITIINLPYGPTAHFNLSSIKLHKDILNHAKLGAHKPELVLNGFSSRLGQTIGRFVKSNFRMFASLFPDIPEFEGRQVCTLHNQRDFIFFRRHRYIFRNGEKCDIQEIGPRFTLKLEFLQKGIYDMKFGEYEWKHKPELDTSRQKFHL